MKLLNKKGVAGLELALSVIALIFVIGLLVMIFALMTGELQDTDSVKASESANTNQTNFTFTDAGTTLTECNAVNQGTVTSITVDNVTEVVPSTNYTIATCLLTAIGTSVYNGTNVTTNYTFTYAGTAWDIANETVDALSETPDWFPIVIVITFMVVLILLTVLIIRAIQGSGLTGGGSSGGGAFTEAA